MGEMTESAALTERQRARLSDMLDLLVWQRRCIERLQSLLSAIRNGKPREILPLDVPAECAQPLIDRLCGYGVIVYRVNDEQVAKTVRDGHALLGFRYEAK